MSVTKAVANKGGVVMFRFLRASIITFIFCFILLPTLIFAADPSKDPFYTMGQYLTNISGEGLVYEYVSPFSGYLTLAYTDIFLPGNGGLDLRIMRTYNSCIWGRRDTSSPGLIARNENSPLGIGWSMHMGIVRNPYGTGSSNRYLPDNPVVEMPDGSQHTLFRDKNDSSRFISKDFWIYKFINGIWDLTLTDGTKYTFEYNDNAGYQTLDYVKIAQVTSIKNAAGTSAITISYYKYGYSYLTNISDSVGRNIQFNYDYTNFPYTLTSITAAGRTFYYSYQTIIGNKFLSQVTLPVGNPWSYTYYSNINTYDLQQITFPAGGTITYNYNDIYFDTGATNVKFRVATQRTTGGRDINAGTWTYQYSSGGSSGDITTVTAPDGIQEVHKFYGWGYCLGSSGYCGNVWKMGLPISKEIYLNSSLILSETFSWSQGTQVSWDDIANANWSGTGGLVYDNDIYVSFLSSKSITRDGQTYTTNYSGHDFYGNPGTISESSDKSRTTSISYWYNTSKNIVQNKPSSETVSGGFPGTFTTTYTYDNNTGNLTQLNKYGVITNYSYYPEYGNGNLYSMTDANGRTTYYEWSNGKISRITNPIYSISRSINSNGTIANETNGRGYTTSFGYDNNLRLTSISPPSVNPANFTYPSDNSYKQESRGGYYIYSYYDGLGRPSGTSDSKGVTTDIVYKSCGPKNYSTSNIGDTVYYDNFGRVTSAVHQDSASISYSYSGSNVTMRNEINDPTTYTYNAFGNPDEKFLVAVNDPAGNTTSYGRNILGSLTSSTQGGITRSFNYNSKNFLDSENHPETGTITYGRDNVGNMTSKTDALGGKSYGYDSLNRLTNITYGTETISFGYDNADNRTSMTSPSATMSYSHDGVNRLTQKTETIAGRSYTTNYGYDGNDNLTSITYPSGRYVTYGYNSNNEVTSIGGFGGSVSSVSYNTAGLPTAFSFSNGVSNSITYTSRYFTDTIKAGVSNSVLNLDYGYDTRGNTTSITNYLDTTKNQSFGYDSLSRLTSFNGAWGTGSYSHDSTGNRLSKTVAGITTNYSYSSNRVSSTSGGESLTFSYNGYGSLTGTSCSGGNTLTYDMLNNLKEYKLGSNMLASFAYDGDGMRVTKTTWKTTVYHYDNNEKVISETDSNGNLIADNIYLNGKLAAKAEPSALYFYHTDPAGTALAMTNTSGSVVWKTDYKPFGEEQSITGTIENNEKFAGKEKDKETGLYYFGARYLGPKIGRFITVDPVGPVDEKTSKVNEKMLMNPQKINRYAYAGNNPYRYIDPDGLTWTESLTYFGKWATGQPMPKDFGPGTNQVKDMKDAPGVQKAKEAFYNKNEGKEISEREPLTNYKADFGLKGLLNAGLNPTEQFVGSYRVDITPNIDGSININLNNSTSFTSLSYGKGPSWNGGPGGTQTQNYHWTEPDK